MRPSILINRCNELVYLVGLLELVLGRMGLLSAGGVHACDSECVLASASSNITPQGKYKQGNMHRKRSALSSKQKEAGSHISQTVNLTHNTFLTLTASCWLSYIH